MTVAVASGGCGFIADVADGAQNEITPSHPDLNTRSRSFAYMPIKVQCACGKAFAAKDELAGKTVKCPGCQKPLKIPASAAPVAKAAAKPAAGKAPAAAKAPVAAPAPVDDLFDELGLAPPTEGTRPCPGCTEPLPLEAIVCVKCGFNTRMGRRMSTERAGGGEALGHGAIAQDLLDQAASVIDGDAAEEKKKVTEGMPWWVYLVGLILLICLATFMLMRGGDEEKTEEGKKGYLPYAQGPYV